MVAEHNFRRNFLFTKVRSIETQHLQQNTNLHIQAAEMSFVQPTPLAASNFDISNTNRKILPLAVV